MREQIGLSGFAVAIPILAAWTKIRIWDFLIGR
jgi:hypothetical protein